MSFFSTFVSAWKNRDKIGDGNKTRELAAFLPAALEIQSSPQNPIAKWLGRSLIILFSLVVIWACVGKVNIVASAEGKIIPSARVKHIQPFENAVVKKILVSEGEYVTEGQALIELDSVLTNADKNRLTAELSSMALNLMVSNGLLSLLEQEQEQEKNQNKNQGQEQGQKKPQELEFTENALPLDSMQLNVDSESIDPKIDVLLHRRLLWQQWQQYSTQKKSLESAWQQIQAQQEITKSTIAKWVKTLPIINQRAKNMQLLYSKKFASEEDYLQLEQERIEKAQDLVGEKQRLIELQASEVEAQQKIYTLTAQTYSQTLTSITEFQQQMNSLQEELAKASDINARQILYSPVDGRVQELAVNTIGGVVTAAQELMLIVPDADQLEVEVFLANQDIGFVNEGMAAEIKIHTFPFTKYGIIDGEITTVSNDAILDEKQGLIYSMNLLMKKNTLLVEGKVVKLMPGMSVTAEVRTGHRRIIEFFLAPLLRYKKEGLRER